MAELKMRIAVGDLVVEPDMVTGEIVLRQNVSEIRIPGFGVKVQSVVDSIIDTNLAMARAVQTGRRYERGSAAIGRGGGDEGVGDQERGPGAAERGKDSPAA